MKKFIVVVLSLVCVFVITGCSAGGKDDNTYVLTATLETVEENGFYISVVSDTSQDLEKGNSVYCVLNNEIEMNVDIIDCELFIGDTVVSQGTQIQVTYLYHYLDLEGNPITVQADKVELEQE